MRLGLPAVSKNASVSRAALEYMRSGEFVGAHYSQAVPVAVVKRRPVSAEVEQKEYFNGFASRNPFGSHSVFGQVARFVRSRVRRIESKRWDVKRGVQGQYLGRGAVSCEVVEGKARRESNSALRAVEGALQRAHGLHLGFSDDELCGWAERVAARIEREVSKAKGGGVGALDVLEAVTEFVLDVGATMPPKCSDEGEAWAVIARACCPKWWRRQARKMQARAMDELARGFRMVSPLGQSYCSDWARDLRRGQNARNARVLSAMVARNDDGQEYGLDELAALGMANPYVKRSELMVRMRGFETVADELGHVGVFFTMTAPSRFHAVKQVKSGGRVVAVRENKNWQGQAVRDGQQWLQKCWAQVRAEWHRRDLRAYGFRVVEPHGDGCPHWHALLFFADKEEADSAADVLRDYFLRDSGDEPGAREYRVKVVEIDKGRGSATGYIAKYIAKNIDGSHLEGDLFGSDAAAAAERIQAWSATHGIRQFQQIGGPSVQVWRELRRVSESLCESMGARAEAARLAADGSDWAAYCLLMGGVFVKRDEQPLRIGRWLETKINYGTGEEVFIDKEFGGYGNESKGNIFGLYAAVDRRVGHWIEKERVPIETRFFRWVIERAGSIKKSIARVSELGRRWLGESLIAEPVPLSDVELDFMRGDCCG